MVEKEYFLKSTPPFPKNIQDILADLFHWEEYLFTWRNEFGKKVGYCTACGQDVSLELGRTYKYEEIENIYKKHNQIGFCPKCGARVKFKDKNRGRKNLIEENYMYFIQHLPRNGGLLLRAVYVRRDFSKKIKTDFEMSEHQRVYFCKNKIKRYCRYPHVHNLYDIDYYKASESSFYWSEMSSIRSPRANTSRICGRFYGEQRGYIEEKHYKKDEFKYFAWNILENGIIPFENTVECLALFYKNPVLFERMIKEGHIDLIKEKISDMPTYRIINWRKKTVPEALNLNREQIKRLRKHANVEDIFILQQEGWLSRERVNDLAELNKYNSFNSVLQLISFIKTNNLNQNVTIKYLAKSCKYIFEYYDYFEQLKKLNIKLEKSSLYPSDFNAAHRACTDELNRIAKEKRLAAERKATEKFKKRYIELKNQLEFISDGFIIRPADGSEELLKEGTTLHHCVYTNYSSLYLQGKTVICLIRKLSEPDEPFYTLEINTEYTNIKQVRGKRNCAATKEVKIFVDKWFKEIQKRKENKKCRKTA